MLWTCPTWVLGTHLSLNWWVTIQHQEGILVDIYVTQCWQEPHTCPESSRLPDFCFFSRHLQRKGTGWASGNSVGMATRSTSSGAVTEDCRESSIKSTRQRKPLSKWSIKCSRQGTEFYSELPEDNWLEHHKACRSPAYASITSRLAGHCRGTVSSHVHLAYLGNTT